MKIWAVDLQRQDLPARRPAPAGLVLAEVTATSAAMLRASMGVDADLVDLRFGRGCRSFIGTVDGEVQVYGWLSTGAEWIGEAGLEMRLPSPEAYVWNCVTAPASRYRGYFRALLEFMVAAALTQGLERLWIAAVDGGAESAVTGAGFRPALRLEVLTLPGTRWLAVHHPRDSDAALWSAARSRLGGGPAGLRSSLRRARPRRH